MSYDMGYDFNGLSGNSDNDYLKALKFNKTYNSDNSLFGKDAATVDNRSFLAKTFKNQDGSLNVGNVQLGLGGLQLLGGLYNAYSQNKLAKDALNFQKSTFRENLHNQRKSYNNSLEDRIRSRYHTEGKNQGESDQYLSQHRL